MDQYLKALIPLAVGLVLIALAPILDQGELAATGLTLVAVAAGVYRAPNNVPSVFAEDGVPDVPVTHPSKVPPDEGDKGAK